MTGWALAVGPGGKFFGTILSGIVWGAPGVEPAALGLTVSWRTGA